MCHLGVRKPNLIEMQVTSCAALHNFEGVNIRSYEKEQDIFFLSMYKRLLNKELEICTNEFYVCAFTLSGLHLLLCTVQLFTISVSF